MATPSLRIRLDFEDRSILSKSQRSNGMNRSWLLIKLQQHRTLSDVCTHLLHIFKLHRSCPNGIVLSMEGFTLPPFESTEILKDKEIICVKKKPEAGNLLAEGEDKELEPGVNGLLVLENNKFDNAGDYEIEYEEGDEETVSKKRKASTNLHNLKKKKRRLEMLDDDDDDDGEVETEIIKAGTSKKKVKSASIVTRSKENVEEANQVSNPEVKKAPSRNARRKKAKRQWKQEIAKIAKKKPQACSNPEATKPQNKEANGQAKGLLYWKQASEKAVQDGDVGPTVTRPGHWSRPLEGDQAAKQTRVSKGTFKWNGSCSSKKKAPKWGGEKLSNFKRNECKRLNKESFKMLFKDSKVPIIDISDFDKLPPCSEPKEGDVIAYRLLELNSSWIPELSSFRVGRISYYDAKDIVLIPVPEYPIVSEKVKESGPNESLYGEDGSLEINYSALVDVRNIVQHDPHAMKTDVNGGNRTPMSKDANSINARRDNISVSTWDRFSSKKIETPKPNHSILSQCSYGGAGPSTSTGPDANKAESSGLKEGQKGNSWDPWLPASKRGASPAQDDGENANSWGRPWSAFVVSRGSSVGQPGKENDWRAGSSRGNGKPWSRGAPRGRGGGRNRGRGRGQNG